MIACWTGDNSRRAAGSIPEASRRMAIMGGKYVIKVIHFFDRNTGIQRFYSSIQACFHSLCFRVKHRRNLSFVFSIDNSPV